jgi:hypothetical protein
VLTFTIVCPTCTGLSKLSDTPEISYLFPPALTTCENGRVTISSTDYAYGLQVDDPIPSTTLHSIVSVSDVSQNISIRLFQVRAFKSVSIPLVVLRAPITALTKVLISLDELQMQRRDVEVLSDSLMVNSTTLILGCSLFNNVRFPSKMLRDLIPALGVVVHIDPLLSGFSVFGCTSTPMLDTTTQTLPFPPSSQDNVVLSSSTVGALSVAASVDAPMLVSILMSTCSGRSATETSWSLLYLSPFFFLGPSYAVLGNLVTLCVVIGGRCIASQHMDAPSLHGLRVFDRFSVPLSVKLRFPNLDIMAVRYWFPGTLFFAARALTTVSIYSSTTEAMFAAFGALIALVAMTVLFVGVEMTILSSKTFRFQWYAESCYRSLKLWQKRLLPTGRWGPAPARLTIGNLRGLALPSSTRCSRDSSRNVVACAIPTVFQMTSQFLMGLNVGAALAPCVFILAIPMVMSLILAVAFFFLKIDCRSRLVGISHAVVFASQSFVLLCVLVVLLVEQHKPLAIRFAVAASVLATLASVFKTVVMIATLVWEERHPALCRQRKIEPPLLSHRRQSISRITPSDQLGLLIKEVCFRKALERCQIDSSSS